MKKNNDGFTLMEILIIICIIAILVTIIMTSLFSARTKSRGMSALSSLRSSTAQAFYCLSSGLPGARLNNFNSGVSICQYNSGPAPGYPNWPDISKSGWDTTFKTSLAGPLNEQGFFWCPIGYKGGTHPTIVGNYLDSTTGMGGSTSSDQFCYMLREEDRYIWCTEDGCKKEGF
jgi:type II secretory pathway pseudopilin PulG